MKGITYFCTDSDGNVYNRYSAGHTAARYTHAVVHRRLGRKASKAGVSYASRRDLAEKNYAATTTSVWDFDTRSWVDGACDLVEVRAYPGRHAVEPTA
jgi:hypothetical protein